VIKQEVYLLQKGHTMFCLIWVKSSF